MLSKRRLFASRAAVIVLAIVSSSFVLGWFNIMWAPFAEFGIEIDGASAILVDVAPQYVSKGIRPGDRVDLAAMPFRERAYLYESDPQPLGLPMTLKTIRGASTRTSTLVTVADTIGFDDVLMACCRMIVGLIYILVAVVLVWGRPNPMLWGLAVFLIRTHPYYMGDLVSPVIGALIVLTWCFVYALGSAGFVVFVARFPDNRTTRTTKHWYVLAAAWFVWSFWLQFQIYVPLFSAKPIFEIPHWFEEASQSLIEVSLLAALCWKLLSLKGPSQRRSFRWVVAGYFIGILLGWSAMGQVLYQVAYYTPFISVTWVFVIQHLLMLTFPASVAYAIMRHRAFSLGFLANRTLVYGAFAVGATSTIVLSVWVASRLTSAIGIGLAMFVALLAGMTFRTSRAFIARFVDRTLLRRRYEAALSLDSLRESLRGSNDASRITDEVAKTLGLSSLAVFSRVADGGFVRSAAFGWPTGSTWHLLPEEPLTLSLEGGGSAIVRLPDDSDDISLPEADARPQFALAVRRGDRVERAILVGLQRNGASLDHDAMRSLHGVFDEAIFA